MMRTARVTAVLVAVCATILLPLGRAAIAQSAFVVTPLAEKKVSQLPAGPLFWRIETFASLAQAQAAAGPTSLATESAGKVWLFTLDAAGGATPGGAKVAEIGPVPPIVAPTYLLRINRAGGPPGSASSIHSHPGSELFYVLSGQVAVTTPSGTMHAEAGQSMNGHASDTPMRVGSSGSTDLDQFVMFVVDASRPFSTPATF